MVTFSNSFTYNKFFIDYDQDSTSAEDYNSEDDQLESELNFIYFLLPKFSVNCGVFDEFQKNWNEHTWYDGKNKDATRQSNLGFRLNFDYYLSIKKPLESSCWICQLLRDRQTTEVLIFENLR